MSGDALSPQRLCSLLDDEAAPADRRAWERALATDPDATRRLAVWRRNDDALRAAFGLRRESVAAGREAPPSPLDPLRARDVQRDPPRGRGLAMLAVGAAFVAGGLCTAAILVLLHMVRAPG